MPERILVVGATGQLGRAVTERLVRNGHRVRALVRDPEQALYLKNDCVELVTG